MSSKMLEEAGVGVLVMYPFLSYLVMKTSVEIDDRACPVVVSELKNVAAIVNCPVTRTFSDISTVIPLPMVVLLALPARVAQITVPVDEYLTTKQSIKELVILAPTTVPPALYADNPPR